MSQAFAQESQPGDACVAGETDFFRRVGGPENPGSGHFLVCDGTDWNLIIGYDTETGTVLLHSGNTADRPSSPINGMLRYNTTLNKFEGYENGGWTNLVGGGAALSAISAATGGNTIASGTNAQIWNWALTGATADAFTFGETSAATGGSGDQSVLKATTLANSTAIPLMVTNLGNGLSFRVNDETGDTDPSPFVVDKDGKVGIGTNAPGAKFDLKQGNATIQILESPGAGAEIYMEGNGTTGGFSILESWWANDTLSFLTGIDSKAVMHLEGATKRVGIGTVAPQAPLHVGAGDAANAAVTNILRLTHETSGAPANGIGTGIAFETETTNNNNEIGALIESVVADNTAASEDFDLVFKMMAGGTAAGEKVRITSVGNVGIGDISPDSGTGGQLKLDVEGPIGGTKYCDEAGNNCFTAADIAGGAALSGISAATGGNTIANSTNAQIWNWALTGATADAFTFGETSAATGGSGDQSVLKATTLANSTAIPLMVTNLGNGLSFRVNDQTGDTDTTPFVIDAAGKVGFGNAAPAEKLHVTSGNVKIDDGNIIFGSPISGQSRTITTNASVSLGLGAASNTSQLVMHWGGRVGIGTVNAPGQTLEIVTGGTAAGIRVNSGDLSAWDVTTDGTAKDFVISRANGTGDFVFDTGFNVGIGTASPDVELDVIGDIEYTGTIADMSDRRLKENIRYLTTDQISHLEKIKALKPVSFTMKSNEEGKTEFGFIAQDVEEIYPELVYARSDDMLSLNYVGMIAPMVAAMQELKGENDTLRLENQALEGRLNRLEQRIEVLSVTLKEQKQ